MDSSTADMTPDQFINLNKLFHTNLQNIHKGNYIPVSLRPETLFQEVGKQSFWQTDGTQKHFSDRFSWKTTTNFPSVPESVMMLPHFAELEYYHLTKVRIHRNNWEVACTVVNHVLNVLEVLAMGQKEYKCIKVRPFIPQGSASEGLKVIEANEFDVLVPLDIVADEDVGKTVEAARSAFESETTKDGNGIPLGWVKFKKIHKASFPPRKSKAGIALEDHLIVENALSPTGVRDNLLKSIIDKAITSFQNLATQTELMDIWITLKSHGPAVTLNIELRNQEMWKDKFGILNFENIEVDLVPAMALMYPGHSGKSVPMFAVPKPFKKRKGAHEVNQVGDKSQPLLWRLSFSLYEQQLLSKLENLDGDFPAIQKIYENTKISQPQSDSCLLPVLRILKSLKTHDINRDSSSEFSSVIASYHLKTLLLQLALDNKKQIEWALPNLVQKTRLLMQSLVKALQTRSLPSVFFGNFALSQFYPSHDFYRGEKQVNLIENIPVMALDNAIKALHECLKENELEWLLQEETSEEKDMRNRALAIFAEERQAMKIHVDSMEATSQEKQNEHVPKWSLLKPRSLESESQSTVVPILGFIPEPTKKAKFTVQDINNAIELAMNKNDTPSNVKESEKLISGDLMMGISDDADKMEMDDDEDDTFLHSENAEVLFSSFTQDEPISELEAENMSNFLSFIDSEDGRKILEKAIKPLYSDMQKQINDLRKEVQEKDTKIKDLDKRIKELEKLAQKESE